MSKVSYFCERCGWHPCRCLVSSSVSAKSRSTVPIVTKVGVTVAASSSLAEKTEANSLVKSSSNLSTKDYCSLSPTNEHWSIRILEDTSWWCTWCAVSGIKQSERRPWN